MRSVVMLVIAMLVAGAAAPAMGQTLQERIAHVRAKQRQARQDEQAAERRAKLRIVYLLNRRMESVSLDEVPAREAFQWWAQRSGVPMVVDWQAMELEGVDPDRPITLELENLSAWHVLRLIAGQTSPDVRLVPELTPWYLQILPRRVANRRTVVRIYDVADLVMPIPQFDDPPRIGLGEQNAVGGRRGGGGGVGGQGLLGDRGGGDDDDDTPTRQENGEALAQLIREVIEPDVWAETAGGESTIRYFAGRLIVRAPPYVHRQIGVPVVVPRDSLRRSGGGDVEREAREE
ncbi:MAG: hypothetical protein ACODAQ_06745 [Phycisphaeraceae bacterium]